MCRQSSFQPFFSCLATFFTSKSETRLKEARLLTRRMQVETEIYNTRHVAAQAINLPASAQQSDPNHSHSPPIANQQPNLNAIDNYLNNKPKTPFTFNKPESQTLDYPKELVENRPIVKNYISHFCSDCHKASKIHKKHRLNDSFNEQEAHLSKFDEIKGNKRKSRFEQTPKEEIGQKRRLELIRNYVGYDEQTVSEAKSVTETKTEGIKKRFDKETEKEPRKQSITLSSNNGSTVTQKPFTFHRVSSKTDLPQIAVSSDANAPLFQHPLKIEESIIKNEQKILIAPPAINLEQTKPTVSDPVKEIIEPKVDIPISIPKPEPKAAEQPKLNFSLFTKTDNSQPLFGPESANTVVPQKTELPVEKKKEEPIQIDSKPITVLPPIDIPKPAIAAQEAKPLFGAPTAKDPFALLFSNNTQSVTPKPQIPTLFETPKVNAHADTPMPSIVLSQPEEKKPAIEEKTNPFITYTKPPQLSEAIKSTSQTPSIFGNQSLFPEASKPLFNNATQPMFPQMNPEQPKQDLFKASTPNTLAAMTPLITPTQSLFPNASSNNQLPSFFTPQTMQTSLFSGQLPAQQPAVKNLFGNEIGQQPATNSSPSNQLPSQQAMPSLFNPTSNHPLLFGKPFN